MQYYSKIRKVEETDSGTYVILQIEDKVKDEILKYASSAAFDSELFVDDRRRITTEQRKKIWATIDDIANYQGWMSSIELKDILVEEFCKERDIDTFSLSRRKDNAASVLIAREFITYLIDFAIEWEVPLLDLAVNRTEEIDAYLYRCLITRTCAITGRKGADIHHVNYSRVGMGRNRYKISHSGLELIALSREWHNKVHDQGEYYIFKKYKVYGIKLDKEGLKKLNLKSDEIS